MTTEPNQRDTGRTLYTLAQQADTRLSATIHSRTNGTRNRWTLTAADEQIPEIREALHEKRVADDRWLAFMRSTPNPR